MRGRSLAILAFGVMAACATEEEPRVLMDAHQSVWKAWYEGDTLGFQRLLPHDLIAINNGGGWAKRDEMIRASADFRRQGGELVSLSFSRQEVQQFGDVAIVYSDYEVVSHVGADTNREAGRATEIFVRRGGEWVNPGWHLDSGE